MSAEKSCDKDPAVFQGQKMRWWHVTLTALMCSLIIVLSLSLYLNSLFINGKIRMEPPNEINDMLDAYSKTKKN